MGKGLAEQCVVRTVLPEKARHHRRDRFVELEDDIADEAVADDDIERPAITFALGQVAPLDIALKAEARGKEQLMRFLHHRVSLLRLFPYAKQADGGIGASENTFGIRGAKPRERHQFGGTAVDIRP